MFVHKKEQFPNVILIEFTIFAHKIIKDVVCILSISWQLALSIPAMIIDGEIS